MSQKNKVQEFAKNVASVMKSNNHLSTEMWFRVFAEYGYSGEWRIDTSKYHDAQCVLLGLLQSLELSEREF
jgi:hypothetical protein